MIPLADFVAKLAHRPDAAEIARHARLDASHVSRAELESESFMDEQLAKWFGDTDEAAARAQPVESEAGRERVKQDVLGMLMASGRYKGVDAEANAETLSLMVGRLADMAGVDPWEHYARYRLRINNQGGQQVAGQKPNTIDPVSDGLLLDALNGVMPSESEAFGPGLARWLVSAGGIQDYSGELAAMDARLVMPGLVNKRGMTLDRALEAATEAGYFTDREEAETGVKSLTVTDFVDALREDLNGNGVYSPSHHDPAKVKRREEIQNILRALDEHEVLREKSPSELAAMNRQDIWDMLFPEDVLEQTAYHGTPHRGIENTGFQLNKIGTGEGAQAYGWGIYFAGQRAVAEHYRKGLSYREQVRQFMRELPEDADIEEVMEALERGDLPQATADVVRALANEDWLGFDYPAQAITAAFKELDNFDPSPELREAIRRYSGQLYQAEIPEDSDLLDFDAPLSKQPPKVRRAIEKIIRDAPQHLHWITESIDRDTEGDQIYGTLGELAHEMRFEAAPDGDGLPGGVSRAASELLLEHGIPGLRYLDGDSRAAGEGSHNYVIWDEALLTPEAAKIEALYQSPAESGASSLEAEIAAERTATERAYGGRAAYDKAKAEGRTKLTYHQWIEVRTPRFKQWFGNWEAVRGVELLESAQPLPLDDVPPLADKKAVENAFRSFDMPANRHDGRKVRFPVSTAGKVVRHKGFDIASVAGAFDRLFESAVPMMSQVEQAREGHKDHTRNIEGYHHYVNRFTRDGKTYYVRFAVQQMLGSRKQAGESLLHSAFVSSVEIYEQNKGAAPETVSVWESPVLTAGATPYDSILSQWLEAGKQGASKVIDPETGEPLVVYHGTDADFTAFDPARSKAAQYGGKGFFFTASREVAIRFGGKIMPVFLSAKTGLQEKRAARNAGIVIATDHIRPVNDERDIWVVFKPNQIKSATTNNGNYSADADSILEQRKADTPRGQIRFLPERTFSIDLFEGADGSTFMHEAAHFVLEQMQDLAEQSEAVKAELDRVRAWLGNDGGKFTTDEHERFARGFELYLREGKAPVPGLRGLFERMKNWLMQAYKHALELNVTLNDDIRGVFDRLLASEAEIEAAKRKQGDNPLALSKEARGLLKAGQYEKYVEAREEALAEAREALLAKLNAAERRKHEQWWKKELKALVAQKLAEIDASPAGRAQQRMRADKSLRLDKAALVACYGKAWTQDSLRALGVYTVKGGKPASSPAVLAATMERGAQTLDEARKHAKKFVGQPLTNQSTGLEARVSNTNLGKMTSEKAGKKSSTAADHTLAVANVDKLFRNALLDIAMPIARVSRRLQPFIAMSRRW